MGGWHIADCLPPRLAEPVQQQRREDPDREDPRELRAVVLGAPDARRLAAFYTDLGGWAEQYDLAGDRRGAFSIFLAGNQIDSGATAACSAGTLIAAQIILIWAAQPRPARVP